MQIPLKAGQTPRLIRPGMQVLELVEDRIIDLLG